MNLRDKKIAILGAGRSGAAAARLAVREGASVTVFDTGNPKPIDDISIMSGDSALTGSTDFDLVVTSPGIDLNWPIAKRFSDAGVKIIGEMELGYHFAKAPVIGITGTNGKSTTTELIATILNGCGQATQPGGNHGVPFCELILNDAPTDVYTLEISSFQLEAVETFRCDTSVWLNFAADHLDRYPGMDQYLAAKMRIFERQRPEDTAVLNLEDKIEGREAQTVTFSAFLDGADYSFDGTHIRYHGEPILDFGRTKMRGAHNAENVMAALAVGRTRGLEFEEMMASIMDYRAPRHRCELAGILGTNEFINDSKATNLHALETSLRALGAPVVLIAGGKDKGLPFGELKEAVSRGASHVVVIGEIGEYLTQVWAGAAPIEKAESLEAAVARAAEVAGKGQTVLFSPGTSSFDMFSGYEQRGDVFCAAVNRLIEK
jgi:UDP-N-acetylmuramoylalanine--D-glutamate ligase